MGSRYCILAVIVGVCFSFCCFGQTDPNGLAKSDKADVVESITALLKEGGNINTVDASGRTALHLAVEANKLNLVDLLIKADIDVNLCDKKGMSPLHFAAEKGYTEIAVRLLEGGTDIESRREDGRTPLNLSVRFGHEKTATMLLEAGANARAADAKGWMPIHIAGIYCGKDMIAKLIEKGASISDRSNIGWNSLHVAASAGKKEAAVFLIESGIDINAFTNDNKTALHIAMEFKQRDIIRLLGSSGASSTIFSGQVEPVLHTAIEKMDIELVKLFLECGASGDAYNHKGISAFQVACAMNDYDIMKVLVDFGTDVNKPGSTRLTVLHWAKIAKNQKKIAWLKKHGAAERLYGKNAITEESDPFLKACMGTDVRIVREFLSNGTGDLTVRDQGGATALHWIAYGHRYVDVLEMAIKQGADVNARDKFGVTPLWWAANRGKEAFVKMLLEHGADIEAKASDGTNPLLKATDDINLSPAVAQLLLSSGADINVCDPEGNTPLHNACDAKHSQIVQLLLSQSAESDTLNNNGQLAIYKGLYNPKVVDAFLKHGFDIETGDSGGATILHKACWGNYRGTVEYLLEQGANINALATDGTPLHYAAYKGRDDLVRLLLEHGADTSIKDSYGRTALDMANDQKKPKVVELLTGEANESLKKESEVAERKKLQEKLADARMRALYGWSIAGSKLHFAASSGDVKELKRLIAAGEDPKAFHKRSRVNFSALHCAVYFDEGKAIEYLLGIGVEVDICDPDKEMTPLHIAAERGHIKAATLLLDAGADINRAGSFEGYTPLHHASDAGHVDMVKLLMVKGADIRIASSHGRFPFHTSVIHKEPEVAAIFLEAGIDINEPELNGGTSALHQACYNTGPVEFLLKRGADATAQASRGTPMHCACVLYDEPETIRLLLEYGADIHAGENGRGTPLHIAAQNGYYQIVKFLLENGADVGKVDSSLRTALHVASSDVRLVKLLMEYGADPSLVDAEGRTPLYYITTKTRILDAAEIIKIYTKAGVDINLMDKNGTNPVHKAIINGKIEMLRVLIECGADLTIPYRGKPPLKLSIERKKTEIQKLLEAQGVTK